MLSPFRSLCTLVCKWTYTSDGGWDDSFWNVIGLEDLVKDKYEKIGILGGFFYTHTHIKTFSCITVIVSRSVEGLDESSDGLITKWDAYR